MIEISHLVVDGCSLAYCQGLEHPHIDGWPALLAKKIGVPVVNLAIGGSAMESIHRRQYDYLYKSLNHVKQNNTKPFHIISLTWAGRREDFFEHYYNTPKNGEQNRYFGYDLSPDISKLLKLMDNGNTDPIAHAAYLEYAHFFNMNLKIEHFKKLKLWASITNLYKAHNYNYCIAEYMNTWDSEVEEFYKNNYLGIQRSLYEDKNYYGDLSRLTMEMPKLPCGHDTKESMPLVADHIYNKILEVYKEIVPVKVDSIYKLQDYYSTNSFEKLAQYNDWLKV